MTSSSNIGYREGFKLHLENDYDLQLTINYNYKGFRDQLFFPLNIILSYNGMVRAVISKPNRTPKS